MKRERPLFDALRRAVLRALDTLPMATTGQLAKMCCAWSTEICKVLVSLLREGLVTSVIHGGDAPHRGRGQRFWQITEDGRTCRAIYAMMPDTPAAEGGAR